MSLSGSTGDALAQRVQRLEDLMAIHQLFIDYGRYLDAGNIDPYAALYAEDGEALLGPTSPTDQLTNLSNSTHMAGRAFRMTMLGRRRSAPPSNEQS